MKRSINDIQNEIIEEFEFFDDWLDKYEFIIDLGKSLPLISCNYKNEAHLIKGCQSQVWLHADYKKGEVMFSADSDAVITKGIIALLIRVLNKQAPKHIAEAKLYFIEKIGLKEHLSPTRSNGLVSMVKQMKLYGIAISSKLEMGA